MIKGAFGHTRSIEYLLDTDSGEAFLCDELITYC